MTIRPLLAEIKRPPVRSLTALLLGGAGFSLGGGLNSILGQYAGLVGVGGLVGLYLYATDRWEASLRRRGAIPERDDEQVAKTP